jgi:hypothetical protein
MTEQQTEDFMLAVAVVIYGACKLVRLLEIIVVMSHERSINPIINPNPIFSH